MDLLSLLHNQDELTTEQQALVSQIDNLEMQVNERYAWFFEYDLQIKQYERHTRLGIVGTYHIGDSEYTIQQLDSLANEKAQEIATLKAQIKELEDSI